MHESNATAASLYFHVCAVTSAMGLFSNDMEKFAEMGRQNFALFQKSMGAFAEAAKGSDLPDEEPPQAAAEPANQEESEIDVLRRELAEMQKRLVTLSKK